MFEGDYLVQIFLSHVFTLFTRLKVSRKPDTAERHLTLCCYNITMEAGYGRFEIPDSMQQIDPNP